MKKASYKWASLLLTLIFVASGFAGCGKSNKSNTTTGSSMNRSTVSKDIAYSTAKSSNIMDYKADENMEFGLTEDSIAEVPNIMIDGMVEGEFNTEEYSAIIENNFNTEEYNAIIENNFKSVKDYPLSTFSVDVDTASYSNIRRMIYSSGKVVPDAVRLEEMINYFRYDYDKPLGDVPFSINTELSDCPWNENSKLLLVGLQARDIDFDKRPSSNLVFLLDVSGSMDAEDKLPLMQKAFTLLTENLNENDRISIVTYAGMETVVLEGARGDEAIKIVSALEDLRAGGSTAGSAGIIRAYELAEQYYIVGGNNRVILATDGDLNVGITSEGELKRLIEQKREKGVFLSVLGFGTENIKDNKMEALADNGNGNYAYIDSVLEAKKVLVEEMGGTLFTVAKDVKLQVEFNPSKIKGYRLIGYENRMLNTEDFNDDTKDAGEIGAGHRVTALYELVDINSEQEIAESDLKYQSKSAVSDSNEWLTINIRYKEPDENTSKLISATVDESIYTVKMSENLSFASSVAVFGMLLRDSKWKGTATYQMILDSLQNQDFTKDEYKDEFISLVKMMKRAE